MRLSVMRSMILLTSANKLLTNKLLTTHTTILDTRISTGILSCAHIAAGLAVAGAVAGEVIHDLLAAVPQPQRVRREDHRDHHR
jgi:hypothetical protein